MAANWKVIGIDARGRAPGTTTAMQYCYTDREKDV